MNRILFVLLLSLSMVSDALAEMKRVAVLEFRGVGIQAAYLLKLSDQSRRAALDVLPNEEYLIMTRENMVIILEDMGLDASCLQGGCEVDVGRNINADLIIAGDIMKIESTYVLTLKLYDTYSGRLLSTFDVEETDLLDLKRAAYRQSQQLIRSGLGLEMPQESSTTTKVNRVQISQQVGATLEGEGYRAKLIPAGTFTMGCTGSGDCANDEFPTHKVTISRDFYMMESEVTQALYKEVMADNPSWFKGLRHPVESVSWLNAAQFANRLSKMEGLEPCYRINRGNVEWRDFTCEGWRLPTEAEWEYAARGGQDFYFAGSNNVNKVARYDRYGLAYVLKWWTHRVCTKKRNGYGLCDMSGNVSEWVWDWYGSYSGTSTVDPQGPINGSDRVVRGGSWTSYGARRVRVSYRDISDPANRWNDGLGFRLVRSSS